MGAKGAPKTGGRTKNTPNKLTQTTRERVSALIENNLGMIENDLKSITDPAQRLSILERYLQYSLPKLQSVSIEAQIEAQVNAEYSALKQLLTDAPDEAVQRIADRVIEMSTQKPEE